VKGRRTTPVILFGDGIAAYGVVRSLGSRAIPIYCVSNTSTGLCKWSRYVVGDTMLPPGDPAFVNRLAEWGAVTVGDQAVLIVAGSDEYLDVLSKGLDKLPVGWKSTFPAWDRVRYVREKHLTYAISKKVGVPFPTTYFVRTRREIERLGEEGIQARWPMLMKPEDSRPFLESYKIKGVLCKRTEDMLPLYDLYKGFGGSLIIQEMVPGGEDMLYCLKTVLNKQSDPLAVFIDRKVRSSGQFLSCSLTVSAWSDDVVKYGLALLKSIGYVGYASVEFKWDERDHFFKLMEINGRVSKNVSHASASGIDLPLILYQGVLDGPRRPPCSIGRHYGDKVIWWCPMSDIRGLWRLLLAGKISNLFRWVSAWSKRKCVVEPWNWRDPGPFVRACFSALQVGMLAILSKGLSRVGRPGR
jgi:D-aspartate ligase